MHSAHTHTSVSIYTKADMSVRGGGRRLRLRTLSFSRLIESSATQQPGARLAARPLDIPWGRTYLCKRRAIGPARSCEQWDMCEASSVSLSLSKFMLAWMLCILIWTHVDASRRKRAHSSLHSNQPARVMTRDTTRHEAGLLMNAGARVFR